VKQSCTSPLPIRFCHDAVKVSRAGSALGSQSASRRPQDEDTVSWLLSKGASITARAQVQQVIYVSIASARGLPCICMVSKIASDFMAY
jgi:hypothetical protein